MRSVAWRRWLPTAAIAVPLALSTATQLQINALEFHTFFRLRNQFLLTERRDFELRSYLETTNTAEFNRDFIRYRDEGVPPVPMQQLEATLNPSRYQNLEASVHAHLSSNHYFF